jgi:hypothetical protein
MPMKSKFQNAMKLQNEIAVQTKAAKIQAKKQKLANK